MRGPSIVKHAGHHDEEVLGRAYDLRLIRRLWRYLRPYRSLFLVSLGLLPLVTILQLAQPYLIKVAIDEHIAAGDLSGLDLIALLFAVALVGEYGIRFAQLYIMQYMGQRAMNDLRLSVFAHVQRLTLAFFDRTPIGRLVTRMTNDVEVLNEMFSAGAVAIVADFVTLAGIVVALLYLDWRLALVTFTVLPFLIVMVLVFRPYAREAFRRIRTIIAQLNAYLQENVSGMHVVQLFCREARNYRAFARINASHRDANFQAIRYDAMLYSLVELVSSVAIAFIIWFGGGRTVQGAIEIGTLVAFIEYIQKFFIPIRDLSTKYTVMQAAMASAERIFDLLDEREGTEVKPSAPSMRGTPPLTLERAIVFEKVWLAYNHGDYVLKDLSFAVRRGEKVALVGATGAGKTSTIKALGRFYDFQRGRITIDGADIRDLELAALRRLFNFVLQEVHLFSGEMSYNIALGDDIPHRLIEQAARRVHAHTFIERLPGGYHHRLDERGANLSAGQRQLLAFARALVHDPEVLILDEATSSVDSETEALIQKALAALLRQRTCIVIAHRLSTIKQVDRILVLHKGRLVEEGRHEELLRRGGIYHRLYQMQYAGQEKIKYNPAEGGEALDYPDPDSSH